MGLKFDEIQPCPDSQWGCVYHACMTDDCQKEVVLSQGLDLGPGKCEIYYEKN
jgi:hypothetical protein